MSSNVTSAVDSVSLFCTSSCIGQLTTPKHFPPLQHLLPRLKIDWWKEKNTAILAMLRCWKQKRMLVSVWVTRFSAMPLDTSGQVHVRAMLNPILNKEFKSIFHLNRGFQFRQPKAEKSSMGSVCSFWKEFWKLRSRTSRKGKIHRPLYLQKSRVWQQRV